MNRAKNRLQIGSSLFKKVSNSSMNASEAETAYNKIFNITDDDINIIRWSNLHNLDYLKTNYDNMKNRGEDLSTFQKWIQASKNDLIALMNTYKTDPLNTFRRGKIELVKPLFKTETGFDTFKEFQESKNYTPAMAKMHELYSDYPTEEEYKATEQSGILPASKNNSKYILIGATLLPGVIVYVNR